MRSASLACRRLELKAVIFAIAVATVTLNASPALAGDTAAAEALFGEAKKLANEGRYAEACPKFAESNRLDRGAGTLIHLADCYEKNRQTASAWATFKDAASAAQGLGRADWQKLATQRAAALEPKLARLTLKVQDPAEKIEVTRDGSTTSPASWGTPIPVDVGIHIVTATAPGRKPFRTTISIARDGDRADVIVTKLEAADPGAAAVAPAKPGPVAPADRGDSSRGSAQRTIGLVVGGVGVVGLGVGVVTGLIAIGKNSDSKDACPNDGGCASSDAVDANSSAKTFGTVSTIAFIAGGVGVVTGAILLLTAPSSSSASATGPSRPLATPRAVRIVPASDGRSATMSIMGVF